MLIGFALSMTMHINFAYYQIVACRSYLWLLLLFTGRDDRRSPQQQYIRRSFWLKPCIRFKFCLENQIHCVLSLTISFSRTRKKITLYMFFVFITQLALLRIPLISRDERVGWNVIIHNRPYLSKRKLGLIFNGPGPADWSVILEFFYFLYYFFSIYQKYMSLYFFCKYVIQPPVHPAEGGWTGGKILGSRPMELTAVSSGGSSLPPNEPAVSATAGLQRGYSRL